MTLLESVREVRAQGTIAPLTGETGDYGESWLTRAEQRLLWEPVWGRKTETVI